MYNTFMRKNIAVRILISEMLILIGLIFYHGNEPDFNSLRSDEKSFSEIISSHKETDRELIQDLTFNKNDLFYDSAHSRWFYSLILNEPKQFDPQIKWHGTEPNVRLVFQNKSLAEISVKENEALQFAAYTDTQYKLYEIICTTLPLIRLETDREFSDQDIPIKFTLFDNRPDTGNRFILSDGLIHIRGVSSNKFPKKSFKIKLLQNTSGADSVENDYPLLDLRNDGDWHLYGAYNDQEKIRNVFSSNLWKRSCAEDNQFGISIGMEYRWVELFINQEYWGLYALGYPIDAKQFGIVPDNRGEYHEYLFKKKAYGEEQAISARKSGFIDQLNLNESELNNALNWLDDYYDLILNLSSNNSLEGYYHNDMDNMLDIFLFTNLIQGDDTVHPGAIAFKNMMVAIKQTENGKQIIYAPWDMDATWGNAFHHEKYFHWENKPQSNLYIMRANPVWILKQIGDEQIGDLLIEKYASLRSGAWSDKELDLMITEQEEAVFESGAFRRDQIRWPDGAYTLPETALSDFRTFVHERLESLDRFIYDSF